MEEVKDIQEQLLDGVRMQLKEGEKLAAVLQDTLFLSADAVYRRIRGDVPFSIFETKTICEKFNLSFDEYGTFKRGKVNFLYTPLNTIGLNFTTYLEGIRDGLKQAKQLKDVNLIMCVNDTPLFQLFNLPHLTRFKFFFWAKTYLGIEEYKNEKFKREKIDKQTLAVGIEAHNIYNSIPTTEIYGPETLRGTLRQIKYYFDSQQFEDPSYALELLDNLQVLAEHMRKQCEIGRKFAAGNEPPSSGNEFYMYSNDTYIADNTYVIDWDGGSAVYFSHNIMNYLNTTDPYYITESKFVLDKLKKNSSIITEDNAKERERFFSSIEKTIQNFRRKIEVELEDDVY
ncbi:MAG: hypothetical protein MK078_05010 [Crocinitomicaceae bacterium]|nr:hypothetical protein [Crocinitomicaceae bacterium]